MEILEFFQLPETAQRSVLEQLCEADWNGAQFLSDLLIRGALPEYSGENPQLLLLMDGDRLVSFCTLSPRDEIHNTTLTPWIGFVYTFPAFRGHRSSQQIIDHACFLAKEQGYSRIYLSSDEYGLYEKYGFHLIGHLPNVRGELTQVFDREL
jgi:GNAT superfamily N-acetyltransferase